MSLNRKIVFVTPVYLPAPLYGSDKYVWLLAQELVARGADVSIITTKALTPRFWYDPIFGKSVNSPYEVIEGVRVYRLNCNFWFSSCLFILRKIGKYIFPKRLDNILAILSSGPWLIGLEKLIRQQKFDIIHVSPFPLYMNKQVVDAIKKLKDKPDLIVTPFFHEQVPDFGAPRIFGLLAPATVIHVISEAEKKEIARRFPALVKKIVVIPLYATFPPAFSSTALRREVSTLRRTYTLARRKIVLFVGIKGNMKGAISVMRAVNELYQSDSAYLLIALGGATSAWNQAKRRVDPRSLLDLDYLDGKMKHAFYALCDVFCLPSKSETFGLVYLEAWHKKKPVIAADIPATRELIAVHKAGKLVKFDDRLALQKMIKGLIENKKEAAMYGNNGYRALMKFYIDIKLIPSYVRLFTHMSL